VCPTFALLSLHWPQCSINDCSNSLTHSSKSPSHLITMLSVSAYSGKSQSHSEGDFNYLSGSSALVLCNTLSFFLVDQGAMLVFRKPKARKTFACAECISVEIV
jgi:hypothetical protein